MRIQGECGMRNRKTDFAKEIQALESRLDRKSKRATNDEEIKQWADSIKQNDDSVVNSNEDLMSEITALEDELMADDDADSDDKPVAASKSRKADDDMEMVADDDEDKDMFADDEEEMVADVEEEMVADVEDTIGDPFDDVSEVLAPDAPSGKGIDVVSKKASKAKFASTLKEAARRLDRVAEYLEKSGKKKLAYRIDLIADAIDEKISSL
jgi:hypothetical protein